MTNYIQQLQQTFERSKSYHTSVAFLFGLTLDILTLEQIDEWLFWLPQIFYLVVGCALWLDQWNRPHIQVTEENSWAKKLFAKHRNNAIHFCLGALMSNYMVLYFKSASIAVSFSFINFILILMILNEWPRTQAKGHSLKSIIFGLCFLSFSTCLAPVLTKQTGPATFTVGLIIALVLISLFYFFLSKLSIVREELRRQFWIPQLIIFVIFSGLYFLKVFPPVPLTLPHIGAYHKVEHTEDGFYRLSFEKPWWNFWHEGDQVFVAEPGDQIFVFFRLFSPTRFNEKLFVVWDYKDPVRNWQEADRILVSVKGGRSEGYRAFVIKKNYVGGDWRVRVLSKDEREIGRLSVSVQLANQTNYRVFRTELH